MKQFSLSRTVFIVGVLTALAAAGENSLAQTRSSPGRYFFGSTDAVEAAAENNDSDDKSRLAQIAEIESSIRETQSGRNLSYVSYS
jgi:hypothetical protein